MMSLEDALYRADTNPYNGPERALAAEVRRLSAELERLREQTPVGWVDADGDFYHGRNCPNVFPTAVPVYAAPAPDSDTVRDAERLAWLLADYGDRSNAVFRAWDGESDLRAVIDKARGAK